MTGTKTTGDTLVQTIIFDLDGTLVDTEPTAVLALKACFKDWKIDLAEEDAQYLTGRTWESAFTLLFKKYPLPLPAEKTKEIIGKRYRDLMEEHLNVVPGGAQAIEALSKEYRLGLVSGSFRDDILWALRKLKVEKYFQIILGAEDYPRSKPHPDGYLKAVQTLGCNADRCLVFEDSAPGIQAARSAGMWVVAITSTNHLGQDQSLAHHSIPDLTLVNPQWVKDLSKTLASITPPNPC